MIVMEQTETASRAGIRTRPQMQPAQPAHVSPINVGTSERMVSGIAGAILVGLGLARRNLSGFIAAGVGGALAFRGLSGHSAAYKALSIDTAKRSGIHVEQAYLISRPADELYAFWRNFENLPQIMSHVEKVEVKNDNRSRWTVRVPKIAGGVVSWDAEITRDEPGRLIAWRSLPGADIDNTGEVRFVPAPGQRGTELHVALNYNPPAGAIGHWIASLMDESPRQQMREDLRAFKRLMETGEIATTRGQPRGTCTGMGVREGV